MLRRLAPALALAAGIALSAAPAQAAQVTADASVTASDGVKLHAQVGGEGSLSSRPTIIEFSPYSPTCCAALAGPDFNYVQVHIRGTGRSDGTFDALGPRTQLDVAEFLEWACDQPWSNGRLGLYGFSASAITAYNSLHRDLPCVETAVLGAGTHELYRDLMYPGGIPNGLPAAGVLGLIAAPYLASVPERLGAGGASLPDNVKGFTDTVTNYLAHPTLDDWWRERGFRGDASNIPILMVTGFFDVESRGPFHTFRAMRDDGAHLYVVGAHDGIPAGSGGDVAERTAWYQRYLRDVPNGVENHPKVQLWMADGDREDHLAGQFVRADGDDWPIPGTSWKSLALSPQRSGSAGSVNDGTLTERDPGAAADQQYPAFPSWMFGTDPHTTSLLAAIGTPEFSGNTLARGFPQFTDMTFAEPFGLSYTTSPLASDLVSAGPASLEVDLSTTADVSDIYAVIGDVSPDGSSHPVAVGRLRTAYPKIDPAKSLTDPATGAVVEPYGRYDQQEPAASGQMRRYQVEFWPIGNRFRQGHRVRLHIVGQSGFHQPSLPALNQVRAGGANGSRLLLPVLPAGSVQGSASAQGAAAPSSATTASKPSGLTLLKRR